MTSAHWIFPTVTGPLPLRSSAVGPGQATDTSVSPSVKWGIAGVTPVSDVTVPGEL